MLYSWRLFIVVVSILYSSFFNSSMSGKTSFKRVGSSCDMISPQPPMRASARNHTNIVLIGNLCNMEEEKRKIGSKMAIFLHFYAICV